MAEILFWFSVVLIVFTYIGYPVTLRIQKWLRSSDIEKAEWEEWPAVSIVVAVKNEQNNIEGRITNLLRQDYSLEKLDIVIVSDGSTDETVQRAQQVAIFQEYLSKPTIRILEVTSSEGKAAALNLGVRNASGEFVVFTDARQMLAPESVKELIRNFRDSSVGAVSGELYLVESGTHDVKTEMGAYWKYEKCIRKLESNTGSVMGVTGAIYAVRKALFPIIPDKTILDDVYVPLKIMGQKYRVVFDPSAKAFDKLSNNVETELHRKVRTLAGNWQLLSLKPSILTHLGGKNIWRFFWHKLARLLVPIFLITLLFSSVALDGWLYRLALIGQVLFYLLAICYPHLPKLRDYPLAKLCYFFCALNVAALFALYVWGTGRWRTVWK